ncbi:hypothetical protein [Bradyrhizobium vignae]|uniref:Uncharacterized protein n=1 Tax=Bradyrhizobium vignae TaxID=1549949 RepID=A0A2U3PRY7_9BRAD|nr:hypothetical protein [Bradyrhizobium vignae]RXH04131.1 hypothetical protein EAV90_11410 [Bradyrhizobium vignae]SPP91896.1 conserved protein of unknown function [Bradyrhizobium vignae]
MDTAGRLRAMAVLCRQTAARHPDRSWKLLAEAEYWEHLARDAPFEDFERCSVGSPPDREPDITKPAAALTG